MNNTRQGFIVRLQYHVNIGGHILDQYHICLTRSAYRLFAY